MKSSELICITKKRAAFDKMFESKLEDYIHKIDYDEMAPLNNKLWPNIKISYYDEYVNGTLDLNINDETLIFFKDEEKVTSAAIGFMYTAISNNCLLTYPAQESV
jgi:hypothetical protein